MSYDFYPLQGLVAAGNGNQTPASNWDASPKNRSQPRAARISTLEVAIRAQSKRFLAHPLVVQQLEAIWAGNIVFHSSADNLHRPPKKVTPNQNRGYGTIGTGEPFLQASMDRLQPAKQRDHLEPVTFTVRRSVTLYDPRDASLFKLSRLRVPRYRQFLSTCSFAILLSLYLAVLIKRSLEITTLEVLFWFWSAGFMLDEVVGFNEQGFSLYIMSFWNMFDVGILLLLVCYYAMRLYGVLMPDARKHLVADTAYDLLATNAVLLFPRLFSILDHYRYFSQLLIAFRMMAMDLVAVFILIVISCSGFFVAFTLSFGNDYDARGVAYALFQMLMGFTPAAWDSWENYNMLGKGILTLFLCICHFLIVTILITVLTNSFMAVVQNANEEHQFVFAVNAISMVKSDALFSYIAPTNVIAWILAPLRFILPFRQFVRLNRTVIKVTHLQILFIIYLYERVILQRTSFEPIDLVEQRGRPGVDVPTLESRRGKLSLFSPQLNRLREPSVATFHKDRALEEVFRRPFRDNTIRNTHKSFERRKTSNVVNSWMLNMGPDGTASPPVEQDRSVVDRLEARRQSRKQSQLQPPKSTIRRRRNFTEGTLSVMSDPEDFVGGGYPDRALYRRKDSGQPTINMHDLLEQSDADGDDELVTNDEEENMTLDRKPSQSPNTGRNDLKSKEQDYFQQTPTSKTQMPKVPSSLSSNHPEAPPLDQPALTRIDLQRPGRAHARKASTVTVLHDPIPQPNDSSSSPRRKAITARNSAKNTGTGSDALRPASTGKRTPKRQLPGHARARPIMPPRSAFKSVPNLDSLLMVDSGQGRGSSFAMELGSDIGDNKAVGGGFIGAVPSSFATQMAFATGAIRAGQAAAASGHEDQRMMGKLMLARMNTLEEGFREVLKEVRDWRREDSKSGEDDRAEKKSGGKGKSKKSARRDVKAKAKPSGHGLEWADQEQQVPEDGRGSSI